MSDRVSFSPKYKEAQAIKHALQKQLEERKDYLEMYGFEMIQDEKEQLEKDIEEEQRLLDKLVERIEDFKYKHQIK